MDASTVMAVDRILLSAMHNSDDTDWPVHTVIKRVKCLSFVDYILVVVQQSSQHHGDSHVMFGLIVLPLAFDLSTPEGRKAELASASWCIYLPCILVFGRVARLCREE